MLGEAFAIAGLARGTRSKDACAFVFVLPTPQDDACVALAVRALLQVVEAGAKSIEIAILRPGSKTEMVSAEGIEAVAKAVEESGEGEAAGGAAAAAAAGDDE